MAARVEYFETFADGSGAPAVISYGRLRFAFDILGEVKCHAVGSVNSSRVERKIALAACRKAYSKELAKLGPEWFALNKAMYADLVPA